MSTWRGHKSGRCGKLTQKRRRTDDARRSVRALRMNATTRWYVGVLFMLDRARVLADYTLTTTYIDWNREFIVLLSQGIGLGGANEMEE